MSEIAKRMFNAYNEVGEWKTFDGRPVPQWEDLGDAVRERWEAAALAARDAESTDVLEFMRKFGQMPSTKHGRELPHVPRHLTVRKLVERFKFMEEELHEFKLAIDEVQAGRSYNLGELADALVDLVYVAKGTANLLGLPWAALWNDVQRANMAKVRGVGKRGNLVDCIKPVGWVPPKTNDVLEKAGYGVLTVAESLREPQWDDPEHTVDAEVERE